MIKLALQTWLTTCLIGTVAIAIYFSFTAHDSEVLQVILTAIVPVLLASMIVTLPALAGFYLLARYLGNAGSAGRAKLLLSGYAIVAGLLTTWLLLTAVADGDRHLDKEPASSVCRTAPGL